MPTTEAGHAPNRQYKDQDGNFHLNGSVIYADESGTSITATELANLAAAQSMASGAGVGFTAGVGAVYKSSIQKIGDLFITRILLDLTGTASSTTDLDVIGVAGGGCHIGQITAAQNGTVYGIRMTCLEAPAGGVTDIDLYSADESTLAFDSAISAATGEVALITAGGAWAATTTRGNSDVPVANQYLYLLGGAGGTAASYTAGKFLIELFGY
jgi:hypothetical protein